MQIRKSDKLEHVCYDIRGPVLAAARRLEDDGFRVAKLNIGDPAAWGFEAPAKILREVVANLAQGQGYGDAQGLFGAREAIMQHFQALGVPRVQVEDIFLGNGVSELITMSLQGLLNDGDEVLIPAPDYPLWTAAANLAGGRPVHYRCDEEADWAPDVADIAARITSRTRAIVVINPNNPTGAVYPRDCLERIVALAREHRSSCSPTRSTTRSSTTGCSTRRWRRSPTTSSSAPSTASPRPTACPASAPAGWC